MLVGKGRGCPFTQPPVSQHGTHQRVCKENRLPGLETSGGWDVSSKELQSQAALETNAWVPKRRKCRDPPMTPLPTVPLFQGVNHGFSVDVCQGFEGLQRNGHGALVWVSSYRA